MSIVCPACGQASQDPEFCDHCNSDLHGPGAAPRAPGVCPLTADGVHLTSDQRALLARPEASLVLTGDRGWQRVHWIGREAWPLWSAGVRERLTKNGLGCLPPVRLEETPEGTWVIADATRRVFEPWATRLQHPYEESERLLGFVRLLADALEELHAQGLVWLTFDPRHLEDNGSGRVRFTNLDLGVFPQRQCPEQLALKSSFAAPEIVRYYPDDIGPRTDVFHLALFAYYWLAGFLPDGFPGQGLESFWFQMPKLRVYAPQLPPGIAGVLTEGMSLDPARRPQAPKALADALQAAVERNRKRRAFQGKLRWEIGSDTRTGRTKTALGKGNEDAVLVRTFANPERALVVVADGITTCDVGSGAMASLIATIVLENNFGSSATQETFAERVTTACRHGAHVLLGWAVEKGYLSQLEEGADLMGTTLTAGWLEGNVLSVANLGDSRAYLIDEAGAEQLTVDGDLASGMLADRVPPESIRDLGPVAKALRECIGGCTFNAKGDIAVLEESCTPRIQQWPLVPGDVIVLCSDGLVEEDAFMEPEVLAEIIRSNRHLSAQELAQGLVESGDNLHRLPSPLEPEGFGDNISCIVILVDSPLHEEAKGP